MKLLALLGSLMLLIYVLGIIFLTFTSLSRSTFDLTEEQFHRRGFWSRQGMIFLWPLAMFSQNGREAFGIIWRGNTKE